ncbi:hypothetical protein AWV80_08500 [Cupriavidus sp. UYMU48A]|nr:hypothetical protein AWV80_08500 [Cupriavidus sp. UYMU48A]
MANWTGTARTNLVAADNIEALETMAADHQLMVIRDSDGRIGFIARTENGDWPTTAYREDLDEHVELCVETVIMPHIKEGEVLIIMEAGSERDRYVSGRAERTSGMVTSAVLCPFRSATFTRWRPRRRGKPGLDSSRIAKTGIMRGWDFGPSGR